MKRFRLLDRILVCVVLLALWQIGSWVFGTYWVSTPWATLSRFFVSLASGELIRHAGYTVEEAFLGGFIGAVPAIILPFALRRMPTVVSILDPFMIGGYGLPKLALAPLFILWFGIGIWSKVIVVISLVLFPVTINTEAGLRTTSERLIEMLRSFGATRRQIFLKVSLPSAVPFILAGLKLGIGRGLIGVVVAELFGSRAGLGRLISQSADAFNMPELFAGVVVLAVAGIVMTAGFGWLEKRLVPWTRD
jgi:NitT/TauT family transport system permease protein